MIETKFKKGDVVFYYDKLSNKILCNEIQKIKVVFEDDKVIDIIYYLRYFCSEYRQATFIEEELFNSEQELKDHLLNSIGFFNIIDYCESLIKLVDGKTTSSI